MVAYRTRRRISVLLDALAGITLGVIGATLIALFGMWLMVR